MYKMTLDIYVQRKPVGVKMVADAQKFFPLDLEFEKPSENYGIKIY